MSKVRSPKAWYLVGVGAAALAADGVRRLIKRRRVADDVMPAESRSFTEIPVEPATRPAAMREAQVAAPVVTASGPDDLSVINGIGPVYAERLNAAGYRTFADVAMADAETLRTVTKATRMANPDEWIAEAKSRL